MDMPALLASKFFRPVLPTNLVKRRHLVARLNDGLTSGRCVSLISAPAGYGKSILVAEWLRDVKRPVAWLSLGESEDDPGRFFTYFTAALIQTGAVLSDELVTTIEAGQLPPKHVLFNALVNGLEEMKPACLCVLDDFHVIEDKMILELLQGLVMHSPNQFHLVLVSREDPALPLARLRASNQLSEIRAADLRFDLGEIERFLGEGMGLDLTGDQLRRLDERTEGWIAGLQLAGIALKATLAAKGQGNITQFIESLSGSHRFFLGYLTEEVLNHQPPEVQDFLLDTSILFNLTGDLCDAVSGQTGSAELLEKLLAANLFLVPLDDKGDWYRYHHLFAELLRSQLQRKRPQHVGELHRRASQWYESMQMPLEAIEHAMAGHDFKRAMSLLEKHGWSLLNHGHARRLEAWMKAIPPEARAHNPRSNLDFAWMHLLRGNFAQVTPYLEQAESALEHGRMAANARRAFQAECLALKSNLEQVQGKISESSETAELALQLVEPENLRVSGLAWLGLGSAYRQAGQYKLAVEALQKAFQLSQASQELVTAMLAVAHLTLMSPQYGRLNFAVEVALQAIGYMKSMNAAPPPIVGAVYGALGWIYYEWNRLDEAREYLVQGIELSTFSGHNASLIYTKVSQARLYQAQGQLDLAEKTLAEAGELYRSGAPAWAGPSLIAQQVRLSLAQGDLAGAEVLLRQSGVSPDGPSVHQTDTLQLAWLRLMVAKGEGVPLAERLITEAETDQRNGTLLQALILGGLAYPETHPTGQAWLNQALELAEPEGYLRIFLDEGKPMTARLSRLPPDAYRNKLLSLFPAQGESFKSALPEEELVKPLTQRELEVLALLAEGLTYKEVAERLVVSVNTIRYHVKGIYGKLGVEKQVQAIEIARRLRLL